MSRYDDNDVKRIAHRLKFHTNKAAENLELIGRYMEGVRSAKEERELGRAEKERADGWMKRYEEKAFSVGLANAQIENLLARVKNYETHIAELRSASEKNRQLLQDIFSAHPEIQKEFTGVDPIPQARRQANEDDIVGFLLELAHRPDRG